MHKPTASTREPADRAMPRTISRGEAERLGRAAWFVFVEGQGLRWMTNTPARP